MSFGGAMPGIHRRTPVAMLAARRRTKKQT
jgi:hypothetical protein